MAPYYHEPWRPLGRRHTVLLCAVAAFLWRGTIVSAEDLFGHSIWIASNIYAYSDWWMTGTMIPNKKALMVTPAVPNRVGMLWHKKPLLTADFEVTFSFSAEGPDASTVRQGFAFWYVQENVTAAMEKIGKDFFNNPETIVRNEWQQALVQQGFDLFGYRSKFNGLGVVFCNQWPTTREAEPANTLLDPTVSAVVGDGNKAYPLWTEMPLQSATKVNYRTGKLTEVVIRVQPTAIKVDVGGQTVLNAPATMSAGGYIGFTSLTGTKVVKEKADVVSIEKIKVVNHDAAKKGEEAPAKSAPAEAPASAATTEDILHTSSKHKDHRDESDAIKTLTENVFKLVMETEPVRQQMGKAIQSLNQRIDVMEKAFNLLKEEINQKSGGNLDSEFDAMKSELMSLSTFADSDNKERQKKLMSLQSDLEGVKSQSTVSGLDQHLDKLTASTQRTLDTLSTGHQKNFGVSIAAVGFVVVSGLALYNKFRCWDKKHEL